MKTKKTKITSLVLALALCLSLVPAPAAALWESKTQPATRQMVVSAIWELENKPVVNYAMPFTDVAGTAGYAEAVRWAAAEGIAVGTGGKTFAPDNAITREQLAIMLYRYALHEKMDVSVGGDTYILSYTDAFDWSAWAAEALQWAVGSGVLSDNNGALRARANLTQGEAESAIAAFKKVMHLSLWTEDAPAKAALIKYMNAITDKASDKYIPPEDRIAVFDMDGTLCCETDPGYFDHKLLYHRVMEDPDYKDKASEEEKETCKLIEEYFATGEYPKGLDVKHGIAVATAFKGMTLEEFDAYVKAYRDTPMESYTNMTNGEAFYQPMLQVVDYLIANDFRVYIVSGTDRLITRGLADGVIPIPLSQMIGSDESLVATHQGDTDGLDYTFTDQDKVVTGGEFLIKNLKMNKVTVILQEIGQQPVLSFGNSTGDASMAEFVTSNNKYESLAFMLCCDDTVRENGNENKAKKMFDLCEQFDWVPVSMKNDWTTIYGDQVVKNN